MHAPRSLLQDQAFQRRRQPVWRESGEGKAHQNRSCHVCSRMVPVHASSRVCLLLKWFRCAESDGTEARPISVDGSPAVDETSG